MSKIRIGISGWLYKPWRGVFYPKGMPQKQELAFAAKQFSSIEINGTFYSLQRPELFARWHDETPEDFVFAVKGPRFITHMKKLRNIKAPLANFFASGMLRLGPKLGPILWQFPAQMAFESTLFDQFLDLLPRDTEQAAALACAHEPRMNGRSWLQTDRKRRMRHAVEIRHNSFVTPEFIALLRRHKVALVCADTVAWPRLMDLTADFVYCRLHGSQELYASGYDDNVLDEWSQRVDAWSEGYEPAEAERVLGQTKPRRGGRDVYLYFDNDAKVRAPVDAAGLIRRTCTRSG